MLYEQHYIKEVDKAMEKLRALCLGQDRKLVEVLPLHMRDKTTKEKAEQLAGQLLFALVNVSYGTHCDGPQQARCRQWLEDLICYLLDNCNEEDHTFYNLMRLVKCPTDVRNLMFEKYLDAQSDVRTQGPPQLLNKLDLAIWWLLGVQGKQKTAKNFFQTLRQDL